MKHQREIESRQPPQKLMLFTGFYINKWKIENEKRKFRSDFNKKEEIDRRRVRRVKRAEEANLTGDANSAREAQTAKQGGILIFIFLLVKYWII